MIGATTTGELSPTGIDGDGFDVFSSLRDGASGEDLSFDIGETVADSAGQFDLVAVASGEAELPSTGEVTASIGQTACATCVGCPFLSQCVKPQALVMKQESERQENVSDGMNSADEEAVPNLMEMTQKQSCLERLLAPDDFDSLDENGRGELVMAGYSGSTDYQEPIIKKAPEPVVAEAKPIDLTTKTDESTEKIIPQEREDKTSTNQAVEASGEDVDTEVAETPFFELKTAPEIAADDTTDAGEALPESASKVLSDTSGEEHFTETAEASSPSIEVKPHVIDDISDAAHNNKPTPESFDTSAQAETAPVSLAINEDTQTGDENRNSLENETAYPMVSEDKAIANVVENTYDGDETTGPSSVTTPSIERQKENDFVITGSKSANSEPSRAAENDESATPVFEQQHLAANFEAVKADESVTTGPIDNSGTKASIDAQPSEINIDAAPDYNNFVESTDSIDNKRLVDTAIIDEAKVNPPNEEIDVLAADQIFTDTQVSSIEQLDYNNVAVERSYDKDSDFWAEEDAVFFVDQQKSPVVESEVSSDEAVTIVLPVETITAHEEADGYKPVEQVTISTSSIIETIPDVESDEVAAKISEECLVPREECELRFVKTSEKSNLLRSDDEIESVIMDASDIKSGINLSGEQAELNDALDDCAYNGEESVANGDDLLMNIHPSSGLWPDDSRLNPENDKTSDDNTTNVVSWLTKLVGAVAVYVACNRRESVVSA